MQIICPCSIKTSHSSKYIDREFSNFIKITGNLSLKNVNISGLLLPSVAIEKKSDAREDDVFIIKLTLNETADYRQIATILLSIAQQISFFINLSEHAVNPHHGTFYVDIDLFNVHIEADSGGIDDKLGMGFGVAFDFSTINFKPPIKYQLFFELFYEGSRSEMPNSKFFHWFLILEQLEYSQKYKTKFSQAPHVFSKEEQAKIRQIADNYTDGKKRNLILSILNPKYTVKNRPDKLYEFITDTLNIKSYRMCLETQDIDKATIADILKARHSLFHPGKSIDQTILWCRLYPLVIEIMKKLIIDEIDIY
jgi:hypothetical protein